MRCMKTILAGCGLLLAAAPLQAQKDFNWHGQIASGHTLEIRGINGDVRATLASGSEAEVSATKTARRGDPDEVEIRVVEEAGGVVICAVYPSRRGSETGDCRSGRNRSHRDKRESDVRVDFQVRVPAGVVFAGATVNGDVTATGLKASASGSTVNGDVEISTGGVARATTVNGSIDVAMGRADWSEGLEFSTVNGGITLTLPAAVSTDLEVSTINGSIESDFPIMIRGRISPRSLKGTLGDGGRDLEVHTVNGSIRIRKQA